MTCSRSIFCVLILGSALFVTACSKDPEVAKREHFSRAEAYAAQKQFREAVIEYRNAIQADPRFGEARFRLAESYVELKDLPNAYREYIRAADLLPDDAPAQLAAAEMLVAAQKFEDARVRVDRALTINPTSVDAQLLKGHIAAGLKDLDAAIAAVDDAVSMDPMRGLTYANLGQLQWAKGDKVAAAAAFNRAVELDPKSVRVHLAQANFLWANGDHVGAERSLRQSVALEPENAAAHRALAFLLMTTKRVPEAEKHFEVIARVSKASRDRMALGDFYSVTGQADKAKTLLRELSRSEDSAVRTSATLRLAAFAIRDRKRAEASRLVDDLVIAEPKNAKALVAQAELRQADGKSDAALESAVAAVEADPRLSTAHFVHGLILASLNRNDDAVKSLTEASQLDTVTGYPQLALARLHLASGKSETALSFARAGKERQPRNLEARLLLVRSLIAQKQLSEAQRELEILDKSTAARVAAVHSMHGRLHLARGNADSARSALERAHAIDPRDLETLSLLTVLDLRSNRGPAAIARVTHAVDRDKDSPAVLLLAARAQLATANVDEAEALARRAVTANPAALDGYSLLGQIYARTKRLPDAQREYEQILQRDPKSVPAHTMIGILLQMQNKPLEAEKRYEQALQVDPRAGVAANNLGWIIAERDGNLDVALQHAQTAVAALPEHPDALDTLGWVYYKKGMNEQAIASFKQAVEKQDGNPTYHYHLGLAYLKAGYRQQAKSALEQALKIQPNFDGSADARAALAKL